ncbi:MAG: hypothetical protein DRO00_04675 [Thermoproteota archaeon]|nr:MAG: hypothetical protein DRO00_04675 [Candidatus Korarchaeota archaeon]
MEARTEVKRRGICEGGLTLKELREKSDRLLQETGYYWGLKELPLKEKEPITYELIFTRLFSALIAAREKAKAVAASPLVREVAEHLTAIYTPEGDAVLQSTGIQVHTYIGQRTIEWMIYNNYEEEVGINPGDIFGCNDNAIAGMHPADVFDLLPVFYDGELVAWVTNVIMEPEIGAIGPGGCMPVANTERFTDGFRVCCEKIGTDYKLRKDFEWRVRFQLRNPDMFLLSRRAALAAIKTVHDEIINAIDEFGLDKFRQFIREVIEESRREQISRVKTRTVPGRARNVFVGEYYLKDLPILPYHRMDMIRIVPMDVIIQEDGKIVIDCDGAGAWGWHSMNVYPMGMEGGLSISLVHMFAYDGKANRGTMIPTELRLPRDTLVNPTTIALPTANCWSTVLSFYGLFMHCISRSLYSRGFREEIIGHGGGMHLWEIGGKDQYGREPYGFFMSDAACCEQGSAMGIRDSPDVAQEVYTTEPDMGSIEVWELTYPLLYLARNCAEESASPGRFRSGRAAYGIYMVHKTDKLLVSAIPLSPRRKILPNACMYGGYPGLNAYVNLYYDTNIKELIEQKKPIPTKLYEILKLVKFRKMEVLKPTGMGSELMKEGDLIEANYQAGSGGFGDPLDRDPWRVKKDLDDLVISPEIAKKVYGVECYWDENAREWRIDEEKTRQLRQQYKQERLRRGIPTKEWWRKERKRILNKDIPSLLVEMYQSSSAPHRGERWFKEFKEFWALPEDFTF